MATEKPAGERNRKLSWWKFFLILIIAALSYIASYFADSFCGGYWMIPEMDGHDRYSFGLVMPTAFLWQPRFGHEAIGNYNFLGILYDPLIRFDRAFIHKTIYLSDDKGFDTVAHLPISKVHPQFRDDYVTKVTAIASRNERKQAIQCTLRLTGSDSPRTITEIWMSREMEQALDASPPEDFVGKPFEDYQKHFNEKYIRWVGKLSLPRDQDVILVFPVKHLMAGSGTIRFQCDLNKKTEINHSIICLAKLGEKLASQTQ
ncbi:MAG TPA: hypothetical protein VIK53_07455 [Verrucomicrobiae bacterium]